MPFDQATTAIRLASKSPRTIEGRSSLYFSMGSSFTKNGLLSVGSVPAVSIDSLRAVSYTHLRAHETVLDLVCRLLLEKKTRKMSTIVCMKITPKLIQIDSVSVMR